MYMPVLYQEAGTALEDGRRLAVALCDQEVIAPSRIFLAVPELDQASREASGHEEVTLVKRPFDLKQIRELVSSALEGP